MFSYAIKTRPKAALMQINHPREIGKTRPQFDSIPNLYELLLPKKKLTDPEVDGIGNKIEYRGAGSTMQLRQVYTKGDGCAVNLRKDQ